MLEYIAVYVVRNLPAASASRLFIGIFSSRGPSGSMRPGSTPRRFTFRQSCRAAFGGPRPLSRPGVRRRCGPPGRAFLLSGLKISRLRNVLHTNYFCWIIAGGASASMQLSRLNRARRFGAGFIVGGVRLNLARRYGPRRFFVVWEFGARAFGIASPSLAL